MKRFIFGLLCLLLASSTLAAVTVSEAYQASLTQSEFSAHQASDLRQTSEGVFQAESATAIKLNGVGSTQWNTTQLTSGKDTNTSTLGLLASLPLSPQSRLTHTIDSKKALLSSKKWSQKVACLNLYGTVSSLFYTLLQIESTLSSQHDLLAVTQQRVNELKQRVQIGRSKISDVYGTELQEKQIEASIEALELKLNENRQLWYQLTLLSPESDLSRAVDLPYALPTPDYATQISHRPDIQALQQHIASLKHDSQAIQDGGLPDWESQVQGQYVLSPSINKFNLLAGITVNFPWSDGGFIASQTREAQEKVIQKELELNSQTRAAHTQIKTTYENFSKWLKHLQTLEKAVLAANKNYLAVTQDYDRHLVTNLEVLQALNLNYTAKQDRDTGLFQAQLAYIQLKLSMGEMP